MSSRAPRKESRRGGVAPGWMRRGGFRRLSISPAARWEHYDAIRRLFARLQRPVSIEEIAADLGRPTDEVHPYSLISVRMVMVRKIPGSDEMGFVPTDLAMDLNGALRALNLLPSGAHEYRVLDGRTRVTKTLKVDRAFKSRIHGLATRAKGYLGVRSYRNFTSDRLPQLLEAIRQSQMARSTVPQTDWASQTPLAQRARKNALNRVGDFRRFLEWAEAEGYVDLRFLRLHNKSGIPMLSRAWAHFHSLAPKDAKRDYALTLARRAMSFGCNSPEDLFQAGFDRFVVWLSELDLYRNLNSVRGALARFRHAWNERAAIADPPLPEWEPPVGHMRERLEDGGLVRTWWSAGRAQKNRPGILDEPDMKEQKKQVRDMRDWWTMADPSTRPISSGGPLPPRPDKAPGGNRRIGATSEDQPTAYKPLWTVSRFCRFAMTDDPDEGARISLEAMKQVDWVDLWLDSGRVMRFIHFEMQRSADQHEGKLVKTQGTDAALYAHLIPNAYFMAWIERDLERLEEAEIDLPDCPDPDTQQAQIRRDRSKLLKRKKQLQAVAKKAHDCFRREEERLGGMVEKKNKAEIAKRLPHEDISRIADAFRRKRQDTEVELRRRTSRLQGVRAKARAMPCEAEVAEGQRCGVTACDLHHPEVTVVDGIATELVDRTYSFLCMKELWIRYPSLVPFRPSEFARTQIGVHLNPEDLEYSAPRYKNPRTGGTVQRREVVIPALKPIFGLDPESTSKLVEVLRRVVSVAQPYLASNPTKRGAAKKSKVPNNDRHLFLTYDGLCFVESKHIGGMVRRTLEEGAKLVNENLAPNESRIVLPKGWGTRGSYVFRFLWGHRSVEEGVSMSKVALALGNSESTVRKYYQKVRSDTAINAVADETNSGMDHQDEDTEPSEAREAGDTFQEEVMALVSLKKAGEVDEAGYKAMYDDLKRKHGVL